MNCVAVIECVCEIMKESDEWVSWLVSGLTSLYGVSSIGGKSASV